MIRFLADENFSGTVLRAILRRDPSIDIVRVQDVGLAGADDPAILEWAGAEGRVLLTNDIKTMVPFAFERVAVGLPMPGVFEVGVAAPLRQVIDDLLLLAECSVDGEWEGQVIHLPL